MIFRWRDWITLYFVFLWIYSDFDRKSDCSEIKRSAFIIYLKILYLELLYQDRSPKGLLYQGKRFKKLTVVKWDIYLLKYVWDFSEKLKKITTQAISISKRFKLKAKKKRK